MDEIQRSGARVAMITTRGFRDVLEIGRTRRMLPSLYDPTFVRPAPLVPRPLRFEVAVRRPEFSVADDRGQVSQSNISHRAPTMVSGYPPRSDVTL